MFHRSLLSSSARPLRVLLNLWLALFLTLGPTTLQAATFYVAPGGDDGNDGTADDPFATIGRALFEASAADEIVVLPGLYDEESGEEFPLTLVDGVNLHSRDGAAVTTISAPQGTSVFANTGIEFGSAGVGGPPVANNGFMLLGGDTILDGFTLRHDDEEPDEDAVMVFANGIFEPVIRNNVFIGGPTDDESFGDIGIYADPGEAAFAATIENNTFTGFGIDQGFYFGYFYAYQIAAISIVDDVDDPDARVAAGVGGPPRSEQFEGPSIAPTISNNTFRDNYVAVSVGGYYLELDQFRPVIDSNTFHDNFADIYSIGALGAVDYDPVISNNTSTGAGVGIIAVHNPYIWIEEASVAGRRVASEDMSKPDATTTIRGNRIADPWLVGIALLGGAYDEDQTHAIRIQSNTITGAGGACGDMEETSLEWLCGTGLFVGYAGTFTDTDGTLDLSVISNTAAANQGPGFLMTDEPPFTSGALGLEPRAEVGPVEGDILMTGNVFTGNEVGAVIDFEEPENKLISGSTISSASVAPLSIVGSDFEIFGNLFQNNVGNGLDLGPGDVDAPVVLGCNTFTGNGGDGVVLRENYGGGEVAANFGDGANPAAGGNSFLDNDGYDFRNEDSGDVPAIGNFWGSTTGIGDRIRDDADDGELGEVVYDDPLQSAAACTTTVDLDVSKTAIPSRGVAGVQVFYTLTVTNNGSMDATNVHVTDPLPTEVTFVSASPACSHAAGTVTCSLEEDDVLEPGESAEWEIVVQINGGVTADFINTAYGAGDEADSDGLSTGAAAVTVGAAAEVPVVPTVDEWGLILMVMLLSAGALWMMRRGQGPWLLLLVAFAGAIAFVPAAAAADRVSLEKATLESLDMEDQQVVLRFAERAPVVTTPVALRVADRRPVARAAGAPAVRRFEPRRPMTPSALSLLLRGREDGGQPVVIVSGAEGVRVVLVGSERQADRMIARFAGITARRAAFEKRTKAN